MYRQLIPVGFCDRHMDLQLLFKPRQIPHIVDSLLEFPCEARCDGGKTNAFSHKLISDEKMLLRCCRQYGFIDRNLKLRRRILLIKKALRGL